MGASSCARARRAIITLTRRRQRPSSSTMTTTMCGRRATPLLALAAAAVTTILAVCLLASCVDAEMDGEDPYRWTTAYDVFENGSRVDVPTMTVSHWDGLEDGTVAGTDEGYEGGACVAVAQVRCADPPCLSRSSAATPKRSDTRTHTLLLYPSFPPSLLCSATRRRSETPPKASHARAAAIWSALRGARATTGTASITRAARQGRSNRSTARGTRRLTSSAASTGTRRRSKQPQQERGRRRGTPRTDSSRTRTPP